VATALSIPPTLQPFSSFFKNLLKRVAVYKKIFPPKNLFFLSQSTHLLPCIVDDLSITLSLCCLSHYIFFLLVLFTNFTSHVNFFTAKPKIYCSKLCIPFFIFNNLILLFKYTSDIKHQTCQGLPSVNFTVVHYFNCLSTHSVSRYTCKSPVLAYSCVHSTKSECHRRWYSLILLLICKAYRK
jgi:hypothetical protein